jgi:hypothetical protein
MNHPQLRRSAMLADTDPSTSRGLEFGPLMGPLVGRHEGAIEYVDHASTADLRIKYAKDPAVDVTRIVDVDHVLEDGRLPAHLRGGGYDYVIASHVFEHLPDPLGWLAECAAVLRIGGVVGLAVPDKRFTFDRIRPLTRLADWVEARLEDRRRPSPRHVFEGAMNSVRMPAAVTWQRPPTPEELVPQAAANPTWALSIAEQALRGYFDIHCSVVTPRSCLELLADSAAIGLHPFRLASFVDTVPDSCEFFLRLALDPAGSPHDRAATFRQAATGAHAGSSFDRAA